MNTFCTGILAIKKPLGDANGSYQILLIETTASLRLAPSVSGVAAAS